MFACSIIELAFNKRLPKPIMLLDAARHQVCDCSHVTLPFRSCIALDELFVGPYRRRSYMFQDLITESMQSIEGNGGLGARDQTILALDVVQPLSEGPQPDGESVIVKENIVTYARSDITNRFSHLCYTVIVQQFYPGVSCSNHSLTPSQHNTAPLMPRFNGSAQNTCHITGFYLILILHKYELHGHMNGLMYMVGLDTV